MSAPRVVTSRSADEDIAAAVDHLRTRGLDPLVLWVIVGNERGSTFYEHLGWRRDGARQPIDFDGTPVDEIRYRLVDPPPAGP